MKHSHLIVALLLAGCGGPALMRASNTVDPGMTKADVVRIMGDPEARSFRGDSEALSYQGVSGYGQCAYVTVWLTGGKVQGLTNRTGPSVAGCSIGAREIDWGQMPRPSIDVNVTTKSADSK